jgi:hypothetical protein
MRRPLVKPFGKSLEASQIFTMIADKLGLIRDSYSGHGIFMVKKSKPTKQSPPNKVSGRRGADNFF